MICHRSSRSRTGGSADHIATKLEAVRCHIVPLTALEGDAFAFAPAEVEQLAEMEHERWVAERRAQGWTRGLVIRYRRPTPVWSPGPNSMNRLVR
jgi:hypothetical protein